MPYAILQLTHIDHVRAEQRFINWPESRYYQRDPNLRMYSNCGLSTLKADIFVLVKAIVFILHRYIVLIVIYKCGKYESNILKDNEMIRLQSCTSQFEYMRKFGSRLYNQANDTANTVTLCMCCCSCQKNSHMTPFAMLVHETCKMSKNDLG